MSLTPTDLRKKPFALSSMIDLSSYELNSSKIENLLKLKQSFTANSNHFLPFLNLKRMGSLIEDEKDCAIFIEMVNFLSHLKNMQHEKALENIFFDITMSLDLKEKFSSASNINIPYLTYIFAFKFDFLHINWLKTFTKFLDLIKVINQYLKDHIEKEERISEIMHIMLIPLNIYSKTKPLQNTYSFAIGINEVGNDLVFFLEEYRNLNFMRLKIPPTLQPLLNLPTFPIILLNYMQTIRKILLPHAENADYKEIKCVMMKEVEFLLQEKPQTQTKLLEVKLKLDKFDNCKVFPVDISEIDENYLEGFENRKKVIFFEKYRII